MKYTFGDIVINMIHLSNIIKATLWILAGIILLPCMFIAPLYPKWEDWFKDNF